jgi:hypothetical protein
MAQASHSTFPGFPEQCRLGHPWKPGTVVIDWRPCECRPASAARGGHLEVICGAPGCSERWQRPQHEPLGILGHHRPGHLAGLPKMPPMDKPPGRRPVGELVAAAQGLPDQLEGAPDNGLQSRPGRWGQCRCRVTEHRNHHEGLALAVRSQKAHGRYSRLGAALEPRPWATAPGQARCRR